MREQSRDTRRALIAAASDLLAAGGPGHVTLRAVGAAIEVSRTAPYRHFQGKDDLLSEVAAEYLTLLENEMRGAMAERGQATTVLFRACLTYVQRAWEYPSHYRLAFGGDYSFAPTEVLEKAAVDFNGYFNALVVGAQDNGELIAGDPHDVGPLLWVLLHGMAMSNHLVSLKAGDPEKDYDIDDLTRILDLALRNMTPR